MAAPHSCPRCGRPLAEGYELEGLCPSCLLRLGAEPSDVGGPVLSIEGLGRRFPELEVLEEVGRGGMGVVYRVRQKRLDRDAALKILSPRLASDPDFAARFTREARALARLNHPRIVSVYDFGERDGLYYLLMEYVPGPGLRAALRAKEISAPQALELVPQICDGLAYAHAQGVIHRDIKPENILLDAGGRVKIADFGLAKLVGNGMNDGEHLTRGSQVMGTLHYMAPEQMSRPLEVDHRADIYSLGVLIYELLTHELPVGRFDPPSHKAGSDVRLDEVVLRALEKEPGRRYQQISDLRSRVEEISRTPHEAAPQVPQPEPTGTAQPDGEGADLSLPCLIDEWFFEGFAQANGVLHLERQGLCLEYQVVDAILGVVKSDVKEFRISYADLASAEFATGFFGGPKLIIRGLRMRAFEPLPNRSGQVRIGFARKFRDQVRELVLEIERRRSRISAAQRDE